MWCFIDGLKTPGLGTGGRKKFFSSNVCGHVKQPTCSSSATFIFCSVFHTSHSKDAKNFMLHVYVT
jgi:hypothetical protein